jgi:hypothetical protein
MPAMHIDELLEALEPVATEIGSIHKRIDDIPQPPALDAIADAVVEKHGEALRGKDGQPGEDGADADPVAVADAIFERHADELAGADGKDGAGITAPTFEAGAVYREQAIVTHHLGRYYRALRDTVAEPGDSEDWERVGTSGLRVRGGFDAEADYVAGDLFVKDYGLFLHDGNKATLVAGRGVKGDKGQKGDPGADGKPGAPGADGVGILAIEGKELSLAVVMTNGESAVVDFGPAVESVVNDAVKSHDQKMVVDQITKAIDAFTTHPTDAKAVALRFFRDSWRADVTYESGDLVSYGDLLYLAITQNRGEVCQGSKSSRVWRFFGNASPATTGGKSSGSSAQYTFDFNKQSTPVILTETFQTVNSLAIDRPAGIYLWAVSLTWAYTSTSQSIELRFSTDGGQTWGPTWIMEPKDSQDRMPFFYSFPVQHQGGERQVIMQGRKTSQVGAAQVTISDLWYQRVGMVGI